MAHGLHIQGCLIYSTSLVTTEQVRHEVVGVCLIPIQWQKGHRTGQTCVIYARLDVCLIQWYDKWVVCLIPY